MTTFALQPLLLSLVPIALAVAWAAPSSSPPGFHGGPPRVEAAALSPRERASLARAFVLRWAIEAQQEHGLTPGAWSQRLVPLFARAPARDVRAALEATGFTSAVARLRGRAGQAAIDKVESATPTDQAYTPLVPCRLFDTRLMFEGAVAADGMRSFVLAGLPSYRAQGGLDGDCGLREVEPTAVVVNLTAVQPGAPGFGTLYPFGATRPLASSVNYPTGDTRGNLVVVRVAGPASAADATLYTFARAHYVGDVVGYYAPPRATGLQCLRGEPVSADGAGLVTVRAVACPDGYTPLAATCSTSPEAALVAAGVDGCQARAAGDVRATVTATSICCRVPGRS